MFKTIVSILNVIVTFGCFIMATRSIAYKAPDYAIAYALIGILALQMNKFFLNSFNKKR